MKQLKVLVVGALALAICGSAAASSTSGAVQTLQFTSISTRTVMTPPPSKSSPPQVGGRLVFQDVMYNRGTQLGKPAGARIGRSEGVCTVIDNRKPEAQCLITAHVPNGEIVVVGEGDPGGKAMSYAITGGTGAYATARGTVTATTVNEQKTIVVVRLA
jgi:hypothetical protein